MPYLSTKQTSASHVIASQRDQAVTGAGGAVGEGSKGNEKKWLSSNTSAVLYTQQMM